MKKKIISFLMMMVPVAAIAAGGGNLPMYDMDVDLHNKGSLQNGARLFVNYCMGCHSMSYMRYNRMAEDLGLSEDQVKDNLMFVYDFSDSVEGKPAKFGSLMENAMPPAEAKKMFGTKVPDLTVVSRSRGADWLYTYLRTFYIDESRPYGVNNARFPDVGMPHVLWELEGLKAPVYETYIDKEGKEHKKIVGYDMVKPGKMSEVEYDSAVRDLVNFMVYAGEPVQLERQTIGIWVMLFLALLFVVAYAMKKEFWKDIH